MCIGSVKAQPLPPTPPAPPTMSDPAVQRARSDAQGQLANSGMAATSLAPDLSGQGSGSTKLGKVK